MRTRSTRACYKFNILRILLCQVSWKFVEVPLEICNGLLYRKFRYSRVCYTEAWLIDFPVMPGCSFFTLSKQQCSKLMLITASWSNIECTHKIHFCVSSRDCRRPRPHRLTPSREASLESRGIWGCGDPTISLMHNLARQNFPSHYPWVRLAGKDGPIIPGGDVFVPVSPFHCWNRKWCVQGEREREREGLLE